jgi:hypothetical protein
VIVLVCPNCEREFPVVPLGSTGHCVCGLDFDLRIDGLVVRVSWRPDPNFPQSGTRSYETSFSMTP